MQKVKNYGSLVLCFVLLFVSAFVTSEKISAEIVKIGVIAEPGETKIGVVLRSSPCKDPADPSGNKIITLFDGDILTILGEENDSRGENHIWYKGTCLKNGNSYTGYIRDDMIAISDYNTDPTFEQQLADFPENYHEDLKKLHSLYPNWTFRADNLNLTFSEALAKEDYANYKLINGSYLSLRSMRKGCYDWNTGSWINYEGAWYGASRELIAYYMDPRNFLNTTDVFVYMKQGYESNKQTLEGIEQIIKNTFLDATVADSNDEFYGKKYAEVIMEAAKQSSVSPYILASTIIQEQGINGATLGKGYVYNGVTVYNFMHWKATGKTNQDIINNGAAFAYTSGWTTPSKSIIGGAVLYGKNYVAIGQDTYFYKNYNIVGSANVNHQYAQNVADSYSSAKKLASMYNGNTEIELTFRIPVYKDDSLPSAVSPYPEKSDKLNNYYIKDIQAYGLTPAFDKFGYEYSLSVSGDNSIYVELFDGTSLESPNTFTLNTGDNTVVLTVKSQTGFTNNYIINVHSSANCTLTVTNNKGDAVTPKVINGDTNGDGQVSLSDLSNVRLHLLGKITLSGDRFYGADTNKDGQISLSDLSNIRLHLIGKITLK